MRIDYGSEIRWDRIVPLVIEAGGRVRLVTEVVAGDLRITVPLTGEIARKKNLEPFVYTLPPEYAVIEPPVGIPEGQP